MRPPLSYAVRVSSRPVHRTLLTIPQGECPLPGDWFSSDHVKFVLLPLEEKSLQLGIHSTSRSLRIQR